MEIVQLEEKDLEKIQRLYNDIKANSFTLWDDDYPSKELILWDIERRGLFGVKDGEMLIGITYCGERQEDGEENFTWKDKFEKRGTFARIGVAPKFQGRGIGSLLVDFVLKHLKSLGFDGVRILVGVNNTNAIKLYTKFGFCCTGTTFRYGYNYFLYELRIK